MVPPARGFPRRGLGAMARFLDRVAKILAGRKSMSPVAVPDPTGTRRIIRRRNADALTDWRMMGGAARLIKRAANLLGLEIARRDDEVRHFAHTPALLHQHIAPLATYSPWLNDATFLEAYRKVRDRTALDIYRCYELWSLVAQLGPIEGCILEVGTWRGGSGILLALADRALGGRHPVYLADTFRGVIKTGQNDTLFRGGELADTSAAAVESLGRANGVAPTILEGVFPDETAHRVLEPVALLHCDVDAYRSARDVVEWTLPRLSAGGLIVLDDYGFFGCEGVTAFGNELRARRDLLFLHNLNGHGIFLKR